MNQIFVTLGIASLKPLLSSIFVSPLPLIALVLAGARSMHRRRNLGWLLILLGCSGVWLSTTVAAGKYLTLYLLAPPAALDAAEIAELKGATDAAIVVLGGGRRAMAPEYRTSSLQSRSLERLRYGVWLARATGLPVAFSGGIGWGAGAGPTEAEIAARVADQEFAFTLRWQEGESRDTRENALKTIALLQPLAVHRIVLVTNGTDMRRAVRNFERAAEGTGIAIIAAPMGLPAGGPLQLQDWLPSTGGYEQVWNALHEWVGILAGA